MALTLAPVKNRPPLSLRPRRLYDVGQPGKTSLTGTGDRVDLSAPTSLYGRVAADLRARIYAGEFPAGAVMPSEADLVAEYRRERRATFGGSVANSALRELASEGLVTIGRGRKCVVAARSRWRVSVQVPYRGARWSAPSAPGGEGHVRGAALEEFSDAAGALADAEPAFDLTGCSCPHDVATVEAELEAVDAAHAAARVMRLLREAAGPEEGWQFGSAPATVELLAP